MAADLQSGRCNGRRLAAAAQRLPSADQVTALDLLWRNQLARDLQDKLDRKQMAVEDWPERIEENTRALLADVAASGITTWPEWHRNAVSRAISVPLVLPEKVGLDNQLAEALASTRHEIAGELGEVAEVQVVRNMILGMTDDM